MRLFALLMLPSLLLAAPVPKETGKPAYELKLSAENQLVLNITLQNNTKEPLELPYRNTPFELITVELRGESGKTYKTENFGEGNEKATPGTLTIPAGESTTFNLHTCHYLPKLGDPGQNVTMTAQWKYEGRVIQSEPLIVPSHSKAK